MVWRLPSIAPYFSTTKSRASFVLNTIRIMISVLEDSSAAKFTVLLYPIRYFAQLLQSHFAVALPTLLTDHNQPAFNQNFDMLRDGRPAHFKIFCYGI